MAEKLSDAKIRKIKKLGKEGLKYSEIAHRLDISPTAARGYILYGSPTAYNEELLRRWGFSSHREYVKYLDENRLNKEQKKKIRDKFSLLIRERLQELGKSQGWLSREVDVERQTISLYVHKKTLPKHHNAEKIFSALEVEYSSLENLLEE